MERKRLNRLKVVLAEKNMTNKRLAELVDKDPAMVSKWVTNVAQPNVEMLILISKLLEVSVDDLLWTEDRKSTRLNSSHANISYAVFCLKKKNTIKRKLM